LARPNKAIREAYFSDTDDEVCRVVGSWEASPTFRDVPFWLPVEGEAGRHLIYESRAYQGIAS